MTAQPDTVQRTRDKRTVPLSHERKGARRASEAQQSEKTLTVTLSRITNAYTQSCWIANPAERVRNLYDCEYEEDIYSFGYDSCCTRRDSLYAVQRR